MHRFGAHVSISGGVDKAVDRALKIEANAFQIFVKSSSQWKARPFADGEVRRFRDAVIAAGMTEATVAHSSYLINLASPKDDLWERSITALQEELERCSQLGVRGLVLHPGSHVGSGEEAGLERIQQGLEKVFAHKLSADPVRLLLENTAGQGSNLGFKFEHLAQLLTNSTQPERLGVCIDTCHAFAAGYDLSTEQGYQAMVESVVSSFGIDQIYAFHLNDSKFPLGSKRDRHEHLGEGHIGDVGFKCLVTDDRFIGIPMLLETPKGVNDEGDLKNLSRLRAWAK